MELNNNSCLEEMAMINYTWVTDGYMEEHMDKMETTRFTFLPVLLRSNTMEGKETIESTQFLLLH